MGVAEEIIETDPVLQRIFFDDRPFVPTQGKQAIVITLMYSLAEMKLRFSKQSYVEPAEMLQLQMRAHWFMQRKYSDGYHLRLLCGHDDGCEHVMMFGHRNDDPVFDVDFPARAAMWWRLEQKRPPDWGALRGHRPIPGLARAQRTRVR